MGKRTDYEKRARDYYWTPLEPIKPLVPFLLGQAYGEPCVGGGHLVKGINHYTFRLPNRPRCLWSSDLAPDYERLRQNTPYLTPKTVSGTKLRWYDLREVDILVSNPPFSWNILQALMRVFLSLKPTWLLLPSDMASNQRFSPFMGVCSDIIPVGRVSWMENGQSGMENYSWYLFDVAWDKGYSRHHPRG